MNAPSLVLVLGWKCNSSCIFCIRYPLQKARVAPRRDLPLSEITRALAKYPQLGGVTLSSFGEPTMYSAYDYVALLLGSRLSYVHAITNGSNMSAIRPLLSSTGVLTFSIDSPDRATYESMRRGLSFDAVTQNLREAVRDRAPFRQVGINMVVFERNVGQVYDMARFAAEVGLQYLHLVVGECPEGTEIVGEAVKDDDPRVIAQVVRARMECLPVPIASDTFRLDAQERHCTLPWTCMDVDPDSRAHPCCRAYDVDLGHWLDDDPWNSPKLNRLREQLRSGNLDPDEFGSCLRCKLR